MKRKASTVFPLRTLICAVSTPLLAFGFVAAAAPTQTQPGEVYWREILAAKSHTFSLMFSIERDERMNKPGSSLQSLLVDRKVEPMPDVKDAETFAKLLAARLTAATVSRDPADANWLHVVESTLANDPNYIMDQKVTLKFDGTFDGLLEQLKKESNGKLAKSIQGTTPGPGIDHPEAVKLDVTNCSYREILTKAVSSADAIATTGPSTKPGEPPAPRTGIRWESFMIERDGMNVTLVEIKK